MPKIVSDGFLKNFQYSQKKSVLESSFNKVTSLQACKFTKKRLQHRPFPVKSLYFTYCHSYLFALSLAVICCQSLSCFFTRCHSSSLVIHCHLLYHSLSLVVIRCTTGGHLLSIVVTRCTTSLSFYKLSPSRDIT